MSAVRNWLEEIGLAQYADAFEANDIDTDLLTQIDDQVLKDIGVSSAGHRLRLRNAIAKLAPTSITEGISEVPTSPPLPQAESGSKKRCGSFATTARNSPRQLRCGRRSPRSPRASAELLSGEAELSLQICAESTTKEFEE
jgi:hypothetical protein